MTRDVLWTDEVDAYLSALGRGDRSAALAQVQELRGDGHDVVALIAHLLAPAQLRVGELWVSDTWSVAQEHAATAVSESVITSLALERELVARPAPAAPQLVVSCVEQEWHALPALMVAEHLRAEGYAVSYLGANSSAQGLVRHVHDLGPAAVLLSCSLSAFLPLVRRQIEAVRETGTPVVVGGSGFDGSAERARVLGATAYAPSAAGVADVVRSLPSGVAPAPPLTHAGAEEYAAVFGDREDYADEVEHTLLDRLVGPENLATTEGMEWRLVLRDQLPHVVGSVAGALVADDPGIIAHALTWADAVLRHRGAPEESGAVLREGLHRALRHQPVASSMLKQVTLDEAALLPEG